MALPANLTKLGKITSPFGAKTEQEGFHPGIDIANKKGTPIPSFAPGVVQKTITGVPHGDNSFGNSVIIKDTNGLLHRYSHLFGVNVQPGQQVAKGQNIGSIGDSGATYSPTGGDSSNLDYRIANAFGQYIDPTPLVKNL